MSILYPRDADDPLSLVAIGEQLIEEVSAQAQGGPRHRGIIRLHEHEELVQRMLNAVEPDSYIRPHRHTNPPKPELFMTLRGTMLAVRYSDDGTPVQAVVLDHDGAVQGVEIPGGAWHSVISLEEGSVALEVIQGPYDAATHKEFAPWAPPEDDAEAGQAYLTTLRAAFTHLIPQVAARDIIEAEEDDVY